jgi:hypothetical protein
MREPTATVEGSVFVWKKMSDFRDRRTTAPAEHVSFRVEKGTPLSETVAAASAAGINSDSLAAFATTTLSKSRRRSNDPFLGRLDPDLVICHRALGTAIAKGLTKDGEQLNQREEVAVAMMIGALGIPEQGMFKKARHGVRDPHSKKFIPIPKPTPGPDPLQYGGAYTGHIEHGTGNPAPLNKPTAVAWSHGGATLLRR